MLPTFTQVHFYLFFFLWISLLFILCLRFLFCFFLHVAAVAQMSRGCSSDTKVIVSIPGSCRLWAEHWASAPLPSCRKSLGPDWLCWLRQNGSSERWKMILNAVLLTHDHDCCPLFLSFRFSLQISLRAVVLHRVSQGAVKNKDIFLFSGSLHSIWIDPRIIFYLNQLTSPEKANGSPWLSFCVPWLPPFKQMRVRFLFWRPTESCRAGQPQKLLEKNAASQ